ncbi:hypothetical protein [Streptomyces sp. NPDC007083]|uniref:hypothetical protein n=1 Tax=Streptomyces sp. NPDC007083 TaxID=3156913 RepID=UPI0033D85E0C
MRWDGWPEPLTQTETAEDPAAEVRTGHEAEPGVYHDEHWLAWDYDPDGSGDLIEVHEHELQEGGRG